MVETLPEVSSVYHLHWGGRIDKAVFFVYNSLPYESVHFLTESLSHEANIGSQEHDQPSENKLPNEGEPALVRARHAGKVGKTGPLRKD